MNENRMIINHYNNIKTTLEEIKSDYNPYFSEEHYRLWNSFDDVVNIIKEKISELRQ